MPVSLNNLFGIHEQALLLRGERAKILAGNMANADTPGYKARDIDFKQVLSGAVSNQSSIKMTVTQAGHISGASAGSAYEILYRQPLQPSLDGNTVDVHVEQAAFAENAVSYQVTTTFLSGKIKGLMSAIRGD